MKPNQNLIDSLLNRYSSASKQLREPAPTPSELDTLFKTAVTVPDFGGLRPWQYVVIQGDARAQLGDVFAQAYIARQDAKGEKVDDARTEEMRQKPLRAPLIIVAAAKIKPHAKAQTQDQLISAALGAQHIQLSAQALGYDSIWLSGINTRDSLVKKALGLGDEHIVVGFLYMGTASKSKKPRRPDATPFVTHWTGNA